MDPMHPRDRNGLGLGLWGAMGSDSSTCSARPPWGPGTPGQPPWPVALLSPTVLRAQRGVREGRRAEGAPGSPRERAETQQIRELNFLTPGRPPKGVDLQLWREHRLWGSMTVLVKALPSLLGLLPLGHGWEDPGNTRSQHPLALAPPPSPVSLRAGLG